MATTIWAQASPTSVSGYTTTAEGNATYGVYFTVAKSGTVQAIWFYSPVGGTYANNPTAIALYNSGGTQLALNSSPSWSVAGGNGWTRAAITSTAVSTGTTYVAVYYFGTAPTTQGYIYTGSSPAAWFPATSADGNITAPEESGSDLNGPYNNGSGIAFPGTNAGANLNWLADVEIAFAASFTPDEPLSAQVSPTWQRVFSRRLEVTESGDAPPSAVAVAGAVSALTLAAPAGSIEVDESVSGAVAALTLAAPAGSIEADEAVSGSAAALALAAPAGSVVAGTVIAGAVSALSLAAPAGTVDADGDVTGAPAGALSLAAPAGAASVFTPDEPAGAQVSRTWRKAYAPNLGRVAEFADPSPVSASVTGTPAALSLAAPAGAVAAGTIVAGATAALSLAAPAGTVSASSSVTGTPAALSLAAPAGTVSAAGNPSVAGATAALALAAAPGSVYSSTQVRNAASSPEVTMATTSTPAVSGG